MGNLWVFYLIGGMDAFLLSLSLFQLVRISLNERQQSRSKLNIKTSGDRQRAPSEISPILRNTSVQANSNTRQTWSGKWSFHAVITIFLLLRTAFFMLYPSYEENEVKISMIIMGLWQQLGDTFFIMAYVMLLIFWSQFYHQLLGQKHAVNRIRTFLFVLFIFIISTFGTLFALLKYVDRVKEHWVDIEAICSGTLATVTLLLAAGFLFYAVKLWMILRAFLPSSTRRRAQIQKIVSVGVFCTVSFTIRAVISLITVVQGWQKPTRAFAANIETIISFFFFLEIVPIATMMYLLRKLPKIQDDRPQTAHPA